MVVKRRILFQTENDIIKPDDEAKVEYEAKAEDERSTPFIISDNVSLELPTILSGEYATVLSTYTDNDGNKAVVPPGWTVSGEKGENTIWGKNKSLVIYRIPQEKVSTINWSSKEIENLKKTYNQFVWDPVEYLDSNGTLNGVSFTEKFGRRNYQDDEFSEDKFHETLTGDLALQFESVNKYGGFYISRYNISKSITGEPQSVRGVKPWVNINFDDAKKVASTIENNETVKSHLPFGAEYDSVLEWFIKSNARTRSKVVENSTNWGNYYNTNNSPERVVKTGSRDEWCTNNIYDFTGNVDEWTQEQNGNLYRVIRGGDYYVYGDDFPVCVREFYDHFSYYDGTGFRATLYIK